MDLQQYAQGLSFRFVQPAHRGSRSERALVVLHAATSVLRPLGLNLPLDALNTGLPFDRSDMRRRLRGTSVGRAGLPLAVRALVNSGTAQLGDKEAFVAYGLGDGSALLAAMAGNHDTLCAGIEGPEGSADKRQRVAFAERFKQLANVECHFIASSFVRCMKQLDGRAVGLCLVSAASHDPVGQRLVDCEPHLAENAFVLVDNCNCARTRDAAFQFLRSSRNQYRVLLDAPTGETGPLTLGRGLIVIQLLGRNLTERSRPDRTTSPVLAPAA